MKLKTGKDVDVLGEVLIEGRKLLISKLSSACFVNGILVRYVLLEPSNFQNYNEEKHLKSGTIE